MDYEYYYLKRSFKNYVDQFLSYFDHLPTLYNELLRIFSKEFAGLACVLALAAMILVRLFSLLLGGGLFFTFDLDSILFRRLAKPANFFLVVVVVLVVVVLVVVLVLMLVLVVVVRKTFLFRRSD